MAVVVLQSDLLPSGPNATKNAPANRDKAYLCKSRFTVPVLTAAADIGSTIVVCKLPANGRYLAAESRVKSTAGGAGALLSVGYQSYRDEKGAIVPVHTTFFGTGLSVVAAGSVSFETMTNVVDEFDLPNDLIMTFTVAGANLPIGFTLSGTIGYLAAFVG